LHESQSIVQTLYQSFAPLNHQLASKCTLLSSQSAGNLSSNIILTRNSQTPLLELLVMVPE
jgi:hypothetical protein